MIKRISLLTNGLGLILLSSSANAVNWLNINGYEKPGKESTQKIYGFLQPEWQRTDGSEVESGAFEGQDAFFNSIRPTYKESSQLNLFRARLGMRGRINENWNYSLLTEFGNGVVTQSEDKAIVIMDASLTTDILGPKLRFGQFKYPGSEEAQQGKYDYANFALPSALLVLESFFDGSGLPATSTDPNFRNGTVDAYRDVGLQFFDTHRVNDWEHSWAVMMSNGNGLMRGDNNNKKDLHLYWSSENIYAGKGRKQQGLKLFAWYRDGKRTLTTSDAGEYDRIRKGAGLTYAKEKWSSTLEYINADGMVTFGTDGSAVPGSANNANTAIATYNIKPEAKADGWWGDVRYRPSKEWELLLRHDRTHRDTEVDTQIDFTNTTLGVNYYYDKNSKVMLNYEMRDFEAPHQNSSHPINQAAKALDNRIAVQVFHFFKL